MIPFSSLLAGCRRAALPCGLAVVVLLAPASAAQAQRLLTLVSGVGEAASVGDLGPSIGPVPTAVQVDLDLLRGAPARLEVPTPDGSVLWAERSLFEDRGGGDLMWSGGQPGAGYDTVVLTVEGGRLVGRFGAAGGGVYQIHAERDGRGGIAPIVGPRLEEWCGVDAVAEGDSEAHAHARARAVTADLPRWASSAQGHDRLDILVAYTATAAENWADIGGAEAAIRHAGDYLKMVFRNNEIPVEPQIVHILQASAKLDRVGRDVGRHEWCCWGEEQLLSLHRSLDGDQPRLRREHQADMLYLFIGENPHLHGGSCGRSVQLTKRYLELLDEDDGSFWYQPGAWSTNYPRFCGDYAAVFVHEIGHGLGANHEPANIVPAFDPDPWAILETLVRPYAKGYVNHDVMPSLGTAMSYQGQVEPFFSTARIRPWGGTAVGLANVQDNERTLRETIHYVVRSSDDLGSLEGLPAQPTDFRAWFEGASAHLSWRDNAPDADGYVVQYQHYNRFEDEWAYRWYQVEGRTGAVIPLEFTVPGGRHMFQVRAVKGNARSLPSTKIVLIFPGDPIEPPSDVSATVNPHLSQVEVRWTDNSENETGFDAQLLRGGEPILRARLPANNTSVEFYADRARIQQGAEYGVRVLAFNSAESESSETAIFRWDHPFALKTVAGVTATAIGPTTVRVAWTVDPETSNYNVYAELRDWRDWRYWQPRLPPGDSSVVTGSFDFEGLARGGRYTFEVGALENGVFSLPSYAYLTLGERGPGPRAPSDLELLTSPTNSLTPEGGPIRLSWKDNSSDELGFEIQAGRDGSWQRVAIVPPDTESAVFPAPLIYPEFFLRVFAYNERGFSASSPLEPRSPRIAGLIATAGDTEAELRWDMRFAEAVTKIQVRWKATADLPFDDAVDIWTDLPASAWAYTVTGLKNGTEYAFAVRYMTASGAGPAVTAKATPRDPPSPPRMPPKASFTVSVDCSDDPCRVRTGQVIGFTDTSTGNVTEWRWSFGDGATSDLKSPTHAWSVPGFYEVTLTVGDGSSSDSVTRTVLVEAAAPAGSCRADAETRCLKDSRFEVKANWWSADGESGPGRVVYAGTNDSGLFRFFDPLNWEILLKVLDGCGINGRMWVLGAATTDLGYRILVTDTVTGESRSYENEPGRPAPAIVDTEAFSLPCGGGAAP